MFRRSSSCTSLLLKTITRRQAPAVQPLHFHGSRARQVPLEIQSCGSRANLQRWKSTSSRTALSEEVFHDDWWYTSDRLPSATPGWRKASETLTCLELPNLATVSREEALDYLDNTWCLTDELFASLKNESAFVRIPKHGLRHPMIFYYGHSACFYINKLRIAGILDVPVNAYFEDLFEVGVDEMSWDDMHKNEMTWPTVEEVHAYRRQVYQVVKHVITTHPELEPGHAPITDQTPLWSLFMAFEHDHIHLETSSVLIRELPLASVKPPRHWPEAYPLTPSADHGHYPRNEFLAVPGGNVVLGKPATFPTFGWDNEYGTKTIAQSDVKVQQFMVSNGEYHEFVSAGGYESQEFWSEEGWKWKCFRKATCPTFWVRPSKENKFRLRLNFEEVDMQWSWPVEVNHLEAQAYCQWKSRQDQSYYHLMTEPIHRLISASSSAVDDSEPIMDWKNKDDGTTFAECHLMNLNLSYASCSPVDAYPPNALGLYDVRGNAWELCEDAFSPLPGFRIHPYYDDFSTPCFDGQHNLIMGGSFASCGDNGASIYSRYHFRRHFHQHSGFRLVQTDDQLLKTSCIDAPEGPWTQ